jgi:hypothetical protein
MRMYLSSISQNATMVPTALVVTKHAMVAKISLVKDLKEIVQMDVLKDLMDISVNLQVNM